MALDLFFYGLFMDHTLLIEKGFSPTARGIARADDYALRVGQRATLVRKQGDACFGIVTQLQSREVDELYSEPSVVDYVPEPFRASLLSDDAAEASIDVVCYNLPPDSIGSTVDRACIATLVRLAKDLGLPAGYIRAITSLSD